MQLKWKLEIEFRSSQEYAKTLAEDALEYLTDTVKLHHADATPVYDYKITLINIPEMDSYPLGG